MNPLSTTLMAKVLIRIDSYGKLVPGAKKIHLTSQEATHISRSWESSVHAHWV